MNTKRLRQKILDLAIRGKLVPQDPADEPASALLERIAKEKARLVTEGKIKANKKAKVSPVSSDKSHYPLVWEFVNLEDLWTLISGRDLTPSEYSSEESGIPYITGASNFENGDLTINRWTVCPKVIAQTGDLLLTCKGTVGELFINDKGNVHIARQIMAIRNNYNLNVEFLKYTLSYFIAQIIDSAKGIIPGISREDVLYLELPLPPLAEQSRIVFALNSAMAVIDEIDEHKGDLSSAVQSAKSKILSLAVSGKLVPQDENDEPASVLLDRIKAERSRLVKAGKIKADKREKDVAAARDNSHYEKLPLSAICTLINTAESESGNLPYLDVRYLRTKASPDFKQSGRYIENGTAVILVDGENSGEVFKVHESGYMGSTFRELLINNAFDVGFVLLFIKHYQRKLRESKTGSAIPHLNKKLFAELLIPLISLYKQRQTMEIVNAQFAILDEIASNIANKALTVSATRSCSFNGGTGKDNNLILFTPTPPMMPLI
jgi:type I restriction enzyme S subunit